MDYELIDTKHKYIFLSYVGVSNFFGREDQLPIPARYKISVWGGG